MANYGILRCKKLKSTMGVQGALRHDTRAKVPKNADPEKQSLNFIEKPLKQAMEDFKAKLPEKYRKDATRAIEVVMTASPEFFKISKNTSEFMGKARAWALEHFGKNNLLSFNIHLDETTPHIHAIFVPIRDGRLNAKCFLGGPAQLRKMQDEFYKAVSKPLGLERGVPKQITGYNHTKPGEYKKALEKVENREKELNVRAEQIIKEETRLKELSDNLVTARRTVEGLQHGKIVLDLAPILHGLDQDHVNRFWKVEGPALGDKLREDQKKSQVSTNRVIKKGKSL